MEDLVDDWPVWVVLVVLWCGAFARGAVTYWAGRGVRAGGAHTVALGFLTVGVQTAINAAAGMLRMPLRRFLPAVAVGALLWAALYTTVGLAVADAWLGDLSWWWVAVAVGTVLAVVLGSRWLERPRTARDEAEPAPEDVG